MIRAALLAASTAMAFAVGLTPALAQKAAPAAAAKPVLAVSQHALKIDGFGGSIDGISGGGTSGALSFPLGTSHFGVQVDAMVGYADGQFRGAGGHLFWRDPAKFLLGAYLSYVDWEAGATVSKIGGELEWYHGPLSFEGMLAQQKGDYEGLAAKATVAFYIQNNLRLDASYRLLQGVGDIAAVGVEWQHKKTGLALFANGSWSPSDNSYKTIIGGVRFYAGPSKDLILRHRQDDPVNPEPWDLFQFRKDPG